jgi:phenylpropionate dioxygenase-like ring-hydroxylating dioxygenase large terminal subunit
MFTAQDNERLTRVGPNTAMGRVFRRFWLPLLLSEELAAPDCDPVRVTLLGEKLIAFRDSKGRLGLLDRHCPHRRADLYFGRNEECGLRCTYHGWKFDVDGNVLEMPAEPANTPLLREVKIKSYPVREQGGVIWAYLGDRGHMPAEPPLLEWARVPDAHRYVTKRLQETNFAQGVEGGIDSSHVSILHSKLKPDLGETFRARQVSISPKLPYMATDTAPKFFLRDTDYGFLIGARRRATDNEFYWRITQFLLPFYTMIAPRDEKGPIMGHAWVPIDDYNCWNFTFTWNPYEPLGEADRDDNEVHMEVVKDGSYRPRLNRDNDYGLDRLVQREQSCSGIPGIGAQDTAIQESMGPIVDRENEHLGTGDTAIVAFRRRLLRLAADYERGVMPAMPEHPEWYQVRSAGVVLGKDIDFQSGAAQRLTAAP